MPRDHHVLNPMASQETLISLLHLDPTPMDNASIYEKDLPPLPDEEKTTSSTTASLGLSGSRRGPIYYLTRIQRYSSYTFAFFAGLHLTSTAVIPLIYRSVPYSEPFLLLSRELYQTTFSEPLLVGLPILAHVTSGIAIRLIRRRQNINRYYGGATPGMWALHHSSTSSSSRSNGHTRVWPMFTNVALSGYVFLPLLASHVFVNRVLPLIVEGDSSNVGLQYVAHGFATSEGLGLAPWVSYALLISVGVGHMVWGAAKFIDFAPPPGWARNTVDRVARKRQRRAAWLLRAAIALVAGTWAAGGLGVVARAGRADGWLGGVYDGMYGWMWQAWIEIWENVVSFADQVKSYRA
ncbi:hypothetical protein F4775DRAFT_113281 [Biscogniauxia sp. FL1348]|nr:hypothetical protein F4775DRAFT_113281 [Biscogniauxia sp. FL1348]